MQTINKLKKQIQELQNYVAENTFFGVKIQSTNYPVQIEFYENQIDMFSEDVQESAPTLCFIFDDEMRIVTAEDFKISETVFNKLKNMSKEINRLYLHSFREEIDKVIKPMWDIADGISQVALYRKKYFDKMLNQFEE